MGLFFGLIAVAVVALLPSRVEPAEGQMPSPEADQLTPLDDDVNPGAEEPP